MSSDLWRNAAWTDDARASPSKNSRNGTLPPITATTPRPAHCLPVRGRVKPSSDRPFVATAPTRGGRPRPRGWPSCRRRPEPNAITP